MRELVDKCLIVLRAAKQCCQNGLDDRGRQILKFYLKTADGPTKAELWALNAKNGRPIAHFGQAGNIDLHTGLPEVAQNKFVISNTPGTVFEDLIIMPVRVSEELDAAPGDIRAFNVKTGELAWTFHTIPYPGEFGYETFPPEAYKNQSSGAANNWAGMALDEESGILYVPTGSAAYDFYGANRSGANLFSDCLLALDARTGKRLWHFQTTHHDIWDRDLPAPPNLVKVKREERVVEAVAQITKQGFVFLFDRHTGAPLFPIEERKVPTVGLPGEAVWPTQPFPSKPKPFARQSDELSVENISPHAENRAELMEEFKTYETAVYAPGRLQGTVLLPGYDGGAEWGGAAADPEGILYVNANEMAWIHQMEAVPDMVDLANLSTGERLYQSYCVVCHGAEATQASRAPSLIDIDQRRDKAFVHEMIENGKGMMPGFPMLNTTEKAALVAYLYGEEKKEASGEETEVKQVLPYRSKGYNKFLDNRGMPAIDPPWGTLSAIDLNSGEYLWQIPLGHEPKLLEEGIKNTGTENYGGPVVTASGLLFIAATKDGYLRAFDKNNGELLWEYKLPYAAFATPATYKVDGKQYLVVACGGTKLGTPKGNLYLAFALPD